MSSDGCSSAPSAQVFLFCSSAQEACALRIRSERDRGASFSMVA